MTNMVYQGFCGVVFIGLFAPDLHRVPLPSYTYPDVRARRRAQPKKPEARPRQQACVGRQTEALRQGTPRPADIIILFCMSCPTSNSVLRCLSTCGFSFPLSPRRSPRSRRVSCVFCRSVRLVSGTGGSTTLPKSLKFVYTSRFVRVILAQGPC